MKRVRLVLSPEAEEAYRGLNEKAAESKAEKVLLNAINKKAELINTNFRKNLCAAEIR